MMGAELERPGAGWGVGELTGERPPWPVSWPGE